MTQACPFCEVGESQAILRTAAAFAMADGFPVTPGHTLVIPNRHIATYWEATEIEKLEIWALVERAREMLLESLHPDGFNVGFNSGQAAGQTIDHLHVHVIPRYDGDMQDPTGGVRGVIPSQMRYKE
jgi:diadenosine tetraphosphate (Ap4A) HIT family hydrolase